MRLIDADLAEQMCKADSILNLTDVPVFLSKLPTVEATSIKHGRWSERMVAYESKSDIKEHGDLHFGFQCSECKSILNKTKYCGNCGAKMYMSIKDIIDCLVSTADRIVIFDTYGDSEVVSYLNFAEELSHACADYGINIDMSVEEAISYCEMAKKQFEHLGYDNVGYEKVIKGLERLIGFETKLSL